MERILAVIEPELEAPWVLDATAELARETGGEVTLLAVDDVESQRFSALPRSEILENVRRSAEGAGDYLRERGLGVNTEVRSGRAADTVLEAADALDAALIVVSGSPRTPMVERLLGSLALELVRRARRQVLVVTPPAR
jgi:nucleotide-binding universal stress UspA family protein